MGSIDDLPKRHVTHDLADEAENALTASVDRLQSFLIQQKDRRDYGTDVQLEVRHEGAMTNLRVHAQLKGTDAEPNSDGSVSVSVARTNLNYLLSQPDSFYVCYHRPTRRLLVRFAGDVYHEYERAGEKWRDQTEITVRFSLSFDDPFQELLKRRILTSGRAARDRRLQWEVMPPEHAPAAIRKAVPSVEVPPDVGRATKLLGELYHAGEDAVISGAFLQFEAVLREIPCAMDYAYMAEINLGLDNRPFDRQRVRQSIDVFQRSIESQKVVPACHIYSQGNAWLALGEHLHALNAYETALAQMTDERLRSVAAQCCKNMGTALEAVGSLDQARNLFERAVERNPELGEAHFALALWHRRDGTDLKLALSHLDQVFARKASFIRNVDLQAWRIDLLFRTGDVEGAFRDVQSVIGESHRYPWILSWCARMIATHGHSSPQTAQRSLLFWKRYLAEHPDDPLAEQQRLLCLWRLREAGATDVPYDTFRMAALCLIKTKSVDTAFLWDRIGHWAQWDGNWSEAEAAYRKAFELEPERYGYCLGTALNHLDRHAEALTILLPQAEHHEPDAMSWSQVACAREGLGDIPGCIEAYRRALELDPDYESAWFNLGGIYWNAGDPKNAFASWREGLRRFPEGSQAQRLQRFLPDVYPLLTAEAL